MPSFANPLLLWLLPLMPLLVWWELARKRLALRFSDARGLRDLPAGRRSQAGFALGADAPVVVEDVAAEDRFEVAEAERGRAVRSGVSCVIAVKSLTA